MGIAARILTASVMHRRLFPRVNYFSYRVYYAALPLSTLAALEDGWYFGVNRRALFSYADRDHGARDGGSSDAWARGVLSQHGLASADGEIVLVTMPRILNYAFNPVSFWLCHDEPGHLRAVIAEVNNTFGETHIYVCAKNDGAAITGDDWLEAEKLFHVSPFLEREGRYRFRFVSTPEKFAAFIDYYHANGEKQLITVLSGNYSPLNRAGLMRAFAAIPFVTVKTIVLIHWQALKLFFKRIRYINKPPQRKQRVSRSHGAHM